MIINSKTKLTSHPLLFSPLLKERVPEGRERLGLRRL